MCRYVCICRFICFFVACIVCINLCKYVCFFMHVFKHAWLFLGMCNSLFLCVCLYAYVYAVNMYASM